MSLIDSKRRAVKGTQAAPMDVGATTAEVVGPIWGPIKVYRLGVHLTAEAKSTGTAWVITLFSSDGVTETSLGTATGPDTLAVGGDAVKTFSSPLVVPEGAYLTGNVSTAGNDGQGLVWVDYTEEPTTKGWLDGVTAMA